MSNTVIPLVRKASTARVIHFIAVRRLFIVIASLAISMCATGTASASIEDNAAFFSERAKTDAAREIGEMGKSVKKGVAVETFKEIPDDLKNGVNLDDKLAVNRLCEQWAVKQAKSKGVNGVYVMLVKSPAHLQVVVGNDTQKRAFTLQDREKLVGKMLTKLRAKDFDGALLDGVSFISVTMRANAVGSQQSSFGPSTATPAKSEGTSFLSIVLIGLAVWVVIGVIRALFGNRNTGGMGNPAMTGGGGGFFSSLMGGLFGAAAGMWMYDQFFGNHASASDHQNDSHGVENDQSFSGQDTDYSSSSDSFSDSSGDSGGGDFGGGDSGGGDFGGGDY